jgi:endonuclease/exonuclease/phosphatase family metal-dependent hydrolase
MVTDADQIVRELSASPAIRDADVYLFQEVVQPGKDKPDIGHEVARRLGRQAVFAPSFCMGGDVNQGLAIVSRYPLRDVSVQSLKACNLRFRTRSRIAVGATVDTPSGPVRVYNAHLDTRINPDDRVAQIQPVLQQAAAFNGPRLIGGDLNTNSMRWIGNVLPIPGTDGQITAVDRLMRQFGFSTPFRAADPTFDFLGMHLDWIYLRGLNVRGAGIQPMAFSDHHAIWTRLAVQPGR